MQRLDSLYLLPALNPVSYSEEMICDVVVKAGVEGSLDTHMEENCQGLVFSLLSWIFSIFACSQYILAPVGGVLCH